MPAREIWRYVQERLAPFAPLEMDGLRGDGESISLQAGRGEPESCRYLDGAVSGRFFFELQVRSRDRVRAWDWLQGAAEHFLAGPVIRLDRGRLFRVRPVASPCLLEREAGWYVYGAQFEMEYDRMPGDLN